MVERGSMTAPAQLEGSQPPAETQTSETPSLVAAVLADASTGPRTAASGAAAGAPQAASLASAAHDSPPPKALLDFMLQGWSPPPGTLPEPIDHAEAFAARRQALSARFPGETIVVPSGHLKVRSNDTHYRFRPSSDFYYLTGNVEPDCVLVLEPGASGHRSILFVEPNPGHTDATFFTDRVKGALWVGARLGVPESRARFAVDECRPLGELDAFLTSVGGGARPFRTLRGFSEGVDAKLPKAADRDKQLQTTLAEMRLVKDAVEVDELRAVVASTKRGFEDVIKRLKKAKSEREVEGVFGLRARVEGNDVGYGTIAAAGAHACILHYRANDGEIEPGKLLLLDGGVEGNSLYTADITRTLPIDGRFNKAQRAIYKLVHKAQKAALAEVKPGNDFMDPNIAAMRVLAEGLAKLGILATTAEEALADDKQFYKRYSLHNVSHMLGLDVHDCAEARKETYKLGKLVPGMVLTVEPGLYFQEDDLTVPEQYRGIGVRIEDDVLVTEDGYENLSKDIPSQVDDVEKWMARVWKKSRR
jgi:Xaa-Pro aminopeptidase